jgi:hypothetical protein
MSTVEEIKEAITRLSPREYCELMADLHPFEDDEWDLQMKADAAAGKLDFIDRNIENARRDGTLIPLEGCLRIGYEKDDLPKAVSPVRPGWMIAFVALV